jgi:uncharacterized Zn-binding protein involved in type VI secretion
MEICKNCQHAEIIKVNNTIVINGIKINQNGKDTIKCKCNNVETLYVDNGKMQCSEYTQKAMQ